MDQQTVDSILGVIRHAMTTAGGALIAGGVVTSEQWTSIVGAVVALLGVGWSIYQKRQAAQRASS